MSLLNDLKELEGFDLDDLTNYTDLITTLREELEMRKRKEILDNHKFAIKRIVEHDKNGGDIVRWRTCLPKADGTQGKQLKKSSRQDLEDAIVDFYLNREKENALTFKDVYFEWREYHWKLNNSKDNTKDKYITDYFRFIKDNPIENRLITGITDVQLEQFFLDAIIENRITYHTFGKLFGYFTGTFKYALKHKMIKDNPMNYLDKSDFKSACVPKKQKTAETELLTDDELDLLMEQIYKDMEKHPTNFTFYAVELAAKTGMRVGEIATLKWEDINYDMGYINICRSDKYKKMRNKSGKVSKKEWIVDETKTKMCRKFPIDESIKKSLERIKSVQEKYGMVSEWVFPHPDYGWTRSILIASCCKNKGKQLGFKHPISIHSLRKTLNTDLRNHNVPAKVCASMFGHSEKVNNEYYYYDNSSIVQKQEMIRLVNSKKCYA